MTALAGIIEWSSELDDLQALAYSMCARVPHRVAGNFRVQQIDKHVAFAQGSFLSTGREKTKPQPLSTPDGNLWIIADARIDNRDVLRNKLCECGWLAQCPSDAALILAGQQTWGDTVAEMLLGDFAYAIWDRAKRRLVAARDPATMRPLFFHNNPGRYFAFASEPWQLFCLPGMTVAPDELMVCEYLSGENEYCDPYRTFFRDIARCPGGHLMVIQQNGVSFAPIWHPKPAERLSWASEHECREAFANLFKQAIRDRLDSQKAICVSTSGGYDSSAIIGALTSLEREGILGDSAVELVGQHFTGAPTREMDLFKAVAQSTRFPLHCIEAEIFSLERMAQSIIRNGRYLPLTTMARINDRIGDVVCSTGAKIVLSGHGGDQLLTEGDVGNDLLNRRMYGRYLEEALQSAFTGNPPHFIGPVARLWGKILRPLHRISRRNKDAPPALINEFLTPWSRNILADRQGISPARKPPGYPSSLQRDLWKMMVIGVDRERQIESYVQEGYYNGFCYAMPFYDRRLVEFMLEVPFEWRIPGGRYRAFMTSSLGPYLPPEVIRSNGKQDLRSQFYALSMKQWLPEVIKHLVDSHQWYSQDYIAREQARGLFSTLLNDKVSLVGKQRQTLRLMTGWRIIALELWLRTIA